MSTRHNLEYKLEEEEQGILNAFENKDLTPVKDSKKKNYPCKANCNKYNFKKEKN